MHRTESLVSHGSQHDKQRSDRLPLDPIGSRLPTRQRTHYTQSRDGQKDLIEAKAARHLSVRPPWALSTHSITPTKLRPADLAALMSSAEKRLIYNSPSPLSSSIPQWRPGYESCCPRLISTTEPKPPRDSPKPSFPPHVITARISPTHQKLLPT